MSIKFDCFITSKLEAQIGPFKRDHFVFKLSCLEHSDYLLTRKFAFKIRSLAMAHKGLEEAIWGESLEPLQNLQSCIRISSLIILLPLVRLFQPNAFSCEKFWNLNFHSNFGQHSGLQLNHSPDSKNFWITVRLAAFKSKVLNQKSWFRSSEVLIQNPDCLAIGRLLVAIDAFDRIKRRNTPANKSNKTPVYSAPSDCAPVVICRLAVHRLIGLSLRWVEASPQSAFKETLSLVGSSKLLNQKRL